MLRLSKNGMWMLVAGLGVLAALAAIVTLAVLLQKCRARCISIKDIEEAVNSEDYEEDEDYEDEHHDDKKQKYMRRRQHVARKKCGNKPSEHCDGAYKCDKNTFQWRCKSRGDYEKEECEKRDGGGEWFWHEGECHRDEDPLSGGS